jgi:hypothetical protein
MHFERSGIPEGAWNGWRAWCLRQSEDPLSPGLNKVLDFLAMLCENDKRLPLYVELIFEGH